MMASKEHTLLRSSEDFIVELDGKLRSGRLGMQCEAIVGLPAVFDSHPFPTLVNSVFLRMAEVFHGGSNFLRLCIVKVTEQCHDHLLKIHSCNEVVRRFSATLHSNDPFARALALRVLGALAVLTAEKVAVQQSVRQALEAHEKVEVDAAIFAARCLAAHNAEFAGSLVAKLGASVDGISISPHMQLQLLPTLQHVRAPREAAAAKSLCVQLLTRQSTAAQAVSAVRALSQLACTYIVHIGEHVSVLLSVLQHDTRRQVCLAVFAALDHMACQAAHLWQAAHFKALWEFLGKSSSACLAGAALIVLNSLAWSVVGAAVLDAETYPVCQGLCCHGDCTVASLACGVSTGAALAAAAKRPDDDVGGGVGGEAGERVLDAVCAVQTLLTVGSVLPPDEQERHRRGVQLVLTCAVKLARAYPAYSGDLLRTLVGCVGPLQPAQVLLFCRGVQRMVSVCAAATVQEIIPPIVPALVELAAANIGDVAGGGEEIAVAVADLLLCCTAVDRRALERVLALLQARSLCWPLFCVARYAAQRGVFQVAGRLFRRLSDIVCDDQQVRWLAGLADLCKAEENLARIAQESGLLLAILSESNSFLYEAAVHFSIAKGSGENVGAERVEFVKQYCRMRSEMLTCVQQVLVCATSMKMCGRGDDGILGEMKQCARNLRKVSGHFSSLYRSAFNADAESLLCLRRAAHLCDFLVDCCNALYFRAELRLVQSGVTDDVIDRLRSALRQKFSDAAGGGGGGGDGGTLSAADCLACLRDVVVQLLSVSVHLPPFVFNDCQGTRIQVALWPAPKGEGREERVALAARTHLVLRVEGALRQEGSTVYRNIDMVHIRVSSQHEPSADLARAAADGASSSSAPLVKSLKTQGDAFASEFVLHLVPDVNATHKVLIEVSVTDQDGAVWTTGPTKSVRVVIEDLAPALIKREAQ